jgi:hypothetical protein
LARRELDQYFSTEEAELAGGANAAVTSVAVRSAADAGTGLDQSALSAPRTAASPAAGPGSLPPFPRKFAPAVLLVYLGIAVFLGARTPGAGIFVQVSVSLLLTPVIWRVGGWLYRAWRGRNATKAAAGAAGRAILRLALAASLLWLVWVRGGAWQDGIVAVALPVSIGWSLPVSIGRSLPVAIGWSRWHCSTRRGSPSASGQSTRRSRTPSCAAPTYCC